MKQVQNWIGRVVLLAAAIALTACAGGTEAEFKPEPLGDFKLGYVIAVTENARKGPLSREATPGKMDALLKPAIEKYFTSYSGDKFYHIAVNVDAYVLAVPGVPLVASPKSALILSLNIWDDEAGVKLLDKADQITILEEFSSGFLLGSGLTMSGDEQLEGLVKVAGKKIYEWVVEHKYLFEPDANEPT